MSSSGFTLRELLRQMLGSGGLLALFAIAGGLALALTHAATEDRIREQERATLIGRLSEIVPPARYDNEPLNDMIQLQDAAVFGTDQPMSVYRARRAGKPVALLLTTVAPNGYNGAIRLLVGVNADGRLAGVRVVQHRETPGLGDKIELARHPWISRFTGLSLGQPPEAQWKVRKDGGVFDQFAGATITPRAVVPAVKRTLAYAVANMPALFDAPAEASTADTALLPQEPPTAEPES